MKKGNKSVSRTPIYGQVEMVKIKCYKWMCQRKRDHHVVLVCFMFYSATSHLFQYLVLQAEENVMSFESRADPARHTLLLNTIITVFVVTSALT